MAKLICTNCGKQGKPKVITKGHILIEIILWCCFLVPGLIYSIWRHASRTKCCPGCGAPNMIPVDSPIAQSILSKVN